MYDLTDALNQNMADAREIVKKMIKQSEKQTKQLNILLETLDWWVVPSKTED